MKSADKNIIKHFIAIVPEDEKVFNEVISIKQDVAKKYGSKASLKSPPHITLYMPFKWKEEKEEALFDVLERLANEKEPFNLHLNDFGSFPPRVIYIDLKKNESLQALQKSLVKAIKRNLKLIDKGFEERAYHPHMTIAFRDLKKQMFWKAWNEEFSQKIFQAEIEVKNIALLKHDGKQWHVYRKFSLKS